MTMQKKHTKSFGHRPSSGRQFIIVCRHLWASWLTLLRFDFRLTLLRFGFRLGSGCRYLARSRICCLDLLYHKTIFFLLVRILKIRDVLFRLTQFWHLFLGCVWTLFQRLPLALQRLNLVLVEDDRDVVFV